MARKKFLKCIFWVFGVIFFSRLSFCAEIKDSCLGCHKALDDKALSAPANFSANDMHVKIGISCADCHGGDPSSDDISVAMDAAKGFIGRPGKADIPKLCAKCHSDSGYMKRYNPNIPTDQLSKYEVSQHGILNAQGDKKTAVCTSCHNAHNILSVNNPASPTYALNVPDTCARCHSDKEYMEEYGIPTNQIDDYKESVHGQALLVKGDRSSASCKHCHGNHDAGLPRAIYVGNICSQCHALTYDLFSKSPHKAAHDKLGIPECEVCHGNHKIMKPTDDMLGVGKDGVCLRCHDSASAGFKTASLIKDSIDDLKREITQAKELILKSERLGVEVEDALFDIDEADNSLTKARAYIHSFSAKEVNLVADEGKSLARKAKEFVQKSIDNFNYRRKWYIFVILIIFVFSSALYARIKILERTNRR
ncbi:MAG: cytochrome c3 family protein [Candidatus Omnitrophota bacterium]